MTLGKFLFDLASVSPCVKHRGGLDSFLGSCALIKQVQNPGLGLGDRVGEG